MDKGTIENQGEETPIADKKDALEIAEDTKHSNENDNAKFKLIDSNEDLITTDRELEHTPTNGIDDSDTNEKDSEHTEANPII